MAEPESQLIEVIKQDDLSQFQEILPNIDDQDEVHNTVSWCLWYFTDQRSVLLSYALPMLEKINDPNHMPDGALRPLINQVIEHSPADDQRHSLQFVKLLLDKGADPNDSRFLPPLMHTIDAEADAFRQADILPKTDMLRLLLNHGADPILPQGINKRKTPLRLARDYEFHSAIDILIRYGATDDQS